MAVGEHMRRPRTLTPFMRKVLKLIGKGYSQAEAARRLHLRDRRNVNEIVRRARKLAEAGTAGLDRTYLQPGGVLHKAKKQLVAKKPPVKGHRGISPSMAFRQGRVFEAKLMDMSQQETAEWMAKEHGIGKRVKGKLRPVSQMTVSNDLKRIRKWKDLDPRIIEALKGDYWVNKRRKEARKLYDDGMNEQEIAEELGVHTMTVSTDLKATEPGTDYRRREYRKRRGADYLITNNL